MAEKDFSAWLAELKERNDIVSVVSSYVRLTRKGRHHWGLCPFHHEKTPSFSVNEDLQIYKCFGCGAAGDVIKFVQENEHTDFNGAVHILAERAGMEVPHFGKEDSQAEKKRNELVSIMNAAQEFFVKSLSLPQAQKARDYIKGRGLSKEIVERFGLGFAPEGWENLKTYLTGLGFPIESINETGLMSSNEKRVYDKFRNRIMYPIADDKGTIISFGGRKINPEDEPKYMNCPQTLLYNKSQTLYGLNIAKNYARGNPLIIVEGYMDVITMHEFGFNTAVASCGTSLTQQQARKLKRYTDKVYIGYDGDSAGQSATVRGLDILKDTGLEVFVLSFPDGCDPDDTLRKFGKEYFDGIIKNAKTLEEFKLERIFSSNDISSNEGKLKAAKQAIEIVSKIQLDMERERYIDMISEKTGYSKRAVLNDIEKISGKNSPKENTIRNETPQKVNNISNVALKYKNSAKNNDSSPEARLICLMARDKNCAVEALKIVNSTCFADDVCKSIIEAMQRVFDGDLPFNASEIIANIKGDDDAASKAYDVLMLDVNSLDLEAETVAYANKVRYQFYMRRTKALQEEANKMIASGKLGDEECQRLLKEIERLQKLAKEIRQ